MIETLGFRVEVKDIKVFDDDDHDNRDNDDDKEDEDNKDNHIGVNKDDNDEKGISALGLDRDLGFSRGHQGHQEHRPPDDEEEDDNEVEDNDKDDNKSRISQL